jgi:hypothetical protein
LVLKVRGGLRKQLRRARSVRGAALGTLGILLFGLWFASLLVPTFLQPSRPADPEDIELGVTLGGLVLGLLAVTGALSSAGLYLPREEIERLFSAPIARSDLVRYRLAIGVLRGLFGGAVLGFVTLRRLPSGLFGFAGVMLAVQTLPLVAQTVSLLSGALERRLAERLARARKVLLLLVLLLGLPILILALTGLEPRELPIVGKLLAALGAESEAWREHPVMRVLRGLFAPWAHTIGARSWAEFAPWFGLCALLWLALFELAARLPIDFRELSLDGAARIAARFARLRRGGGAAAAQAELGRGWRVPWLFGRGPFGAVAWRKSAAIVRKAKGAAWLAAIVLALLVALSAVQRVQPMRGFEAWPELFMLLLGTAYLCGGLRFDFRQELERMEEIKAWPLQPWHLFLAMILPEVALVSILLGAALATRLAILGVDHPLQVLLLCALPLFVLAYAAIDNAAWLLFPVRVVAGQDGALQNAGRGMTMMLVRSLVLALALGLAAGAGLLVWKAGEMLSASDVPRWVAAGACAWGVLLLMDVAALLLGGWVLRRFDVARDRG